MLTIRDGALLAAGMWFAGASTFFYRRKQTLPFKVERLELVQMPHLDSVDLAALILFAQNVCPLSAGGILHVLAHPWECHHPCDDAQ